MDKLIDLLQNYPLWFKVCVAGWIVLGALLLVGLITMRPEKVDTAGGVKPPLATTAPSAPRPTNQAPHEISLEEYFTRLDHLRDRFLQRQEFITSLVGREVSWQGYVAAVSEKGGRLSLNLTTAPGSRAMVFVWLPTNFRTQVFSLRPGDLVLVHGILSLDTPSMPDLEGRELTLVTLSGKDR